MVIFLAAIFFGGGKKAETQPTPDSPVTPVAALASESAPPPVPVEVGPDHRVVAETQPARDRDIEKFVEHETIKPVGVDCVNSHAPRQSECSGTDCQSTLASTDCPPTRLPQNELF